MEEELKFDCDEGTSVTSMKHRNSVVSTAKNPLVFNKG